MLQQVKCGQDGPNRSRAQAVFQCPCRQVFGTAPGASLGCLRRPWIRIDEWEISVSITPGRSASPHWHSLALKIAAVYDISWGLWTMLFPNAAFQIMGINPLPNYPELWQCNGMMIAVLGIGFWCAAADSVRHWPIVLVGFLSKILHPVDFLRAGVQDGFPRMMGLSILANDLIWWIPFGSMLLNARCSLVNSKTPNRVDFTSKKSGAASRRRVSSAVVQLTVRASSDARTLATSGSTQN